MKLFTKAEWEQLSPKSQGYVHYLQASLPNSELRGVSNPYLKGTKQYKSFADGEFCAMLETQDMEG